MRKVQPAAPLSVSIPVPRRPVEPPTQPNGLLHTFLATYNRLALKWNRIQIGHRELYSVERLLAFRDYCRRTSPTRVWLVCLLAPLPALLLMLLLECIPLKDPSEGWKANSALWIRLLLSSILVAGGIVLVAKSALEPGTISYLQVVRIAVASAVCYTGTEMVLAATWKFPIPFGAVLMVTPFVSTIMTFLFFTIGFQTLRTDKKLQKQFIQHQIASSAQSLLVMAYPTFNAVFLQLFGVQQAVFVFVLPMIKFVTKQVIANVSAHLEENIGAVTVFTVDVFNVLYVSICMQTARSPLTMVLLISSDVCHLVLALRNIYYHTEAIERHRDREGRNENLRQLQLNCLDRLPAMLGKAFDEFKPRNRPETREIRIFAPFRLPVSTESAALLEELASKKQRQSKRGVDRQPTAQLRRGPTAQSLLQQLGGLETRSVTAGNSKRGVLLSSQLLQKQPYSGFKLKGASVIRTIPQTTEEAVEETLQALFHCEYVMLTEYVECVMPLFYTLYLAGLFHLPARAYYPHTRSLSPNRMTATVVQLMLYGLLEFASLVGVYVMLKRRLGFSPAYQLAFVLETQAPMLQGLLLLWTIFILQLTLVHYGRLIALRASSYWGEMANAPGLSLSLSLSLSCGCL
ncbi:hypothetical protein BBJ28_00022951 [Nothophytophthora sp. Chile5]|nr:hypothetical protein BBJ28_00022951 [Nothophytophthora sp. Chile5]